MTIQTLTIRRPDDWHVHLRDGPMLAAVANYTAQQFARAVIMPNLRPPVVTAADARAYRDRIRAAVSPEYTFEPLMTAYLTDATDPDELAHGHSEGVFTAAKLYPANATTNSAAGVTDIARLRPVFERMQRLGMPLLVHGEVTDAHVDIFDREAVFIEQSLAPLVADFPALKVVFEHITTLQAVDFVMASGAQVAATITPHHLEHSRNAMFAGGIHPHLYCLPVLKREPHRRALRRAAVSGNAKFFLGTDSAPHAIETKETACGCAGVFSAPAALASYAKVFAEEYALDRLEGFASEFGPAFYGLPLNAGTVTLERSSLAEPEHLQAAGSLLVPFHAGSVIGWRVR